MTRALVVAALAMGAGWYAHAWAALTFAARNGGGW